MGNSAHKTFQARTGIRAIAPVGWTVLGAMAAIAASMGPPALSADLYAQQTGQQASQSAERKPAQPPANPAAPTRPAEESKTPMPPPEGQSPVGGAALLKPASGSRVSGSVTVGPEEDFVRITGTIKGLKPNAEHGFHVHERGDCSAADASSAGDHFNPATQPHGRPEAAKKHAGDLLNLKADAQGVAQVDLRVPAVTLRTGDRNDVYNRAIVVHENADDYHSQPAGNSGKRIACGVIE